MTPTTKPGCLPKFLRFLGIHDAGPSPRLGDNITHYTLEPDPEPAPEPLPYRLRSAFLTSAEASFYRVLKSVVNTGAGGYLIICPKVDLDDIFRVTGPDQNYTYWNKINRKHVDFLLINPVTLAPLLAIELDDASHQRPDRLERDRFVDAVFATAGLPLLRIPARQTYSPQDLTDQFRRLLQPAAAATDVARDSSHPEAPVGADLRVGLTAAVPAPSSSPQSAPSSPSAAPSAQSVQSAPSAVPSAVRTFTPDNPPYCPKCGVRMTLKVARHGPNAGRPFFGCPNYPTCREVIPIPTEP